MNNGAETPDAPDTDVDMPEAEWDAAEVMRRRAELARDQRDRSIAELRASISDEDVLEQLGIDLREIER